MGTENVRKINQIEPWVGEEEKEELIKTIESGWITEASRTRQFEQMLAEYVGSKYALAVNNGTVSLVIATLALGIGRGDEVIVPDFTMIASANAVVLAGAKPVLVDIDRETLCISLAAAEAAITPRTKAIMPVPLNGRYPDMEALLKLAQKRNLYIIEDAAQALGSRYKGKHLGTLGDIGSFSFSTPKVITTGQGGMLVTDNEELNTKIYQLKDFGRTTRTDFYHEVIGYNFKFTDFQAAVGIAQMRKLQWRVDRKKDMYRLYKRLLEGIKGIQFVDINLKDTSPWYIDIMVENDREDLASYLKEKEIGTRPFYPALHSMPPYAQVRGDFKNSEYVSRTGLWLPSSSFLTDEDIERVCTEIRNYCQR